MTAVGFVLIVLGVFIGRVFGDPWPTRFNVADYVAIAAVYGGAALALAGIGSWLWSVMP